MADAIDATLGRRDELTPPRRLQGLAGNSDFRATGEEFAGHLRRLAGLSPSDRVLDVGCGAGRIARVLAHELQPPGSYDGFDVVPEVVAWCRKRYRDTAAPFRFELAAVANAMYNPDGALAASAYRFPYEDGAFDLVLATSVFTHLLADAADRYLAEAARVLAPGGRLLTTWFLMAPDGGASIDFGYTEGPASTVDPALPEAAVAFDVDWVLGRLAERGLRVREPVHWGTWSGRPGLSSQDIVVADR